MKPVMIVEMSWVVTGGVSGRGRSPTGLDVEGVAPSTLRVGRAWWGGASVPGVGGAIGRMTVGGIGRLSVGDGVGFEFAGWGPGLVVGECCTGGIGGLKICFWSSNLPAGADGPGVPPGLVVTLAKPSESRASERSAFRAATAG